jgi:DNA-binding CsgD family transcriptional regulator
MEQQKQISNRQFIIVALLMEGLSMKQIAGQLGISIHTVQAHLKTIYRKFDVHSRFELQAMLIRAMNELAD